MLHLLHPGASIQAAQARLGRLPVREHIGHTRRDAQVVLEHLEAIVGPNQVGAADGDPGTVRRGEAAHLDPVLWTASHNIYRDHTVTDDSGLPVDVFGAGLAVDVLQEEVKRLDTLRQPLLKLPPVGARHHARQAVNGDDPLIGLVVPVDSEGDALVLEGACSPLLNAADLLYRELGQSLVEPPAVLSGRAVRQKHLVIYGWVKIVVVEVHSSSSLKLSRHYTTESSFDRRGLPLVLIKHRVELFDAFVRCEAPRPYVTSTEVAVFVPVQRTGSTIEVDLPASDKQG